MSEIFGNIKDLKQHQLKAVQSLKDTHAGSVDILTLQLARKLAKAAFLTRRMVAVFLDRKGEVRSVMVGDVTRLYLPNIGRLRGTEDRLRGLRLIVARPTPPHFMISSGGEKKYCLTSDFKTDLEKLRLDAVVEIDASRDNIDGPLIVAHLATQRSNEANVITVKEESFRSIHQLDINFSHLIDEIVKDLALSGLIKSSGETQKYLEKALLIGVYNCSKKEGLSSMVELKELARSARVQVVESVYQFRARFYPKTFIGTGKLEEICLRALALGVEMLIFDHDLSPSQLNNITDLTDLKILDRSMLILDIFAQRAVTREGKLQVEMAQLSYSLPRLAKKQSGLSRLTGGIGGRGPGETKLEVDKRRVKDRLAKLSTELERIKKQRALRRQSRKNHELPTFAIVGYTNAGKSTLLNALCNAEIYAKDELFATLDPYSRRLRFPHEQEVVVTDTVGFINHLPESLMKAFMATLEELEDADILLHVVDCSDENYQLQISVVEKVLLELNLKDKKRILIFNKIDKLDELTLGKRIGIKDVIKISATDRSGLSDLIDACLNSLVFIKKMSAREGKKSLGEPSINVEFDGRFKG
ncbi:MAG: GTPase HflX [Myxococcales bacterium]|nr:GTPase HflX [Myxococcales bacterium]USN50777.1 MAG: GTPase HflX [Myxococcales bacterium]